MDLGFVFAFNEAISRHCDVYSKLARDAWRDMTPMQYGCLLIGIALVGWLTMKSGPK